MKCDTAIAINGALIVYLGGDLVRVYNINDASIAVTKARELSSGIDANLDGFEYKEVHYDYKNTGAVSVIS